MTTPESPLEAQTVVALLRRRLAADAARPLVTGYDDTTGERAELSAATLDNWVAKTANLLQDELGVGHGASVSIDLPAHWQAVVWVLACWCAGATVTVGEPDADVAVAGPSGLAAALEAGASDVVAVSLRPLAGRWPEPLPAGVVDYAAAVPGHGDRFTPWQPPTPADPALTVPGSLYTQGGLVALARGRRDALGLPERLRLATDASPASLAGSLDAVLLPLLVGGSVVLLRGGSPDQTARLAAERVTVDLRRPTT